MLQHNVFVLLEWVIIIIAIRIFLLLFLSVLIVFASVMSICVREAVGICSLVRLLVLFFPEADGYKIQIIAILSVTLGRLVYSVWIIHLLLYFLPSNVHMNVSNECVCVCVCVCVQSFQELLLRAELLQHTKTVQHKLLTISPTTSAVS